MQLPYSRKLQLGGNKEAAIAAVTAATQGKRLTAPPDQLSPITEYISDVVVVVIDLAWPGRRRQGNNPLCS